VHFPLIPRISSGDFGGRKELMTNVKQERYHGARTDKQ
jgi:hypothetical protein